MPDTPSITLVKRFTYRDTLEEFSNTYHFNGTIPLNDAAWLALADAMILAEKPTVQASVSWVRAYGYEPGNEHSIWQHSYDGPPSTAQVGTMALGTQRDVPGDIAVTVRWYTGQINSRGKKIYCRKYLHGAVAHISDIDEVGAQQKTAMQTWAAKLIDGTLPGSFKYCGPQGATLSSPSVNAYLTTRTLKRRGKRPPPPGTP